MVAAEHSTTTVGIRCLEGAVVQKIHGVAKQQGGLPVTHCLDMGKQTLNITTRAKADPVKVWVIGRLHGAIVALADIAKIGD